MNRQFWIDVLHVLCLAFGCYVLMVLWMAL